MKRIYLIEHKYITSWKYVGATKARYLKTYLAQQYHLKHQAHGPKFKAFRCSEQKDWAIKELHTASIIWEGLEAMFIRQHDTFRNGLNGTANGQGGWPKHAAKKSAKVRSKPIACSNGLCYANSKFASEDLGIHRGNIISVCNGKRKAAGGYTFKYI